MTWLWVALVFIGWLVGFVAIALCVVAHAADLTAEVLRERVERESR